MTHCLLRVSCLCTHQTVFNKENFYQLVYILACEERYCYLDNYNARGSVGPVGSQAGVVDINLAFHLYYKYCMWIELQSISTWLRGFSPGTPVSSLLKIDSQSNPSGCGAALLRGHIWVVFRSWAPNWQHGSFSPTSLSCALWKFVKRIWSYSYANLRYRNSKHHHHRPV